MRASVLTPPEYERHSARIWFSSLRQTIETAFSHLCDNFGLHFPQAHVQASVRWAIVPSNTGRAWIDAAARAVSRQISALRHGPTMPLE